MSRLRSPWRSRVAHDLLRPQRALHAPGADTLVAVSIHRRGVSPNAVVRGWPVHAAQAVDDATARLVQALRDGALRGDRVSGRLGAGGLGGDYASGGSGVNR